MTRIVACALVALLAGCAAWDIHEVRDPASPHSLIGMTVPDLVICMGWPDSVHRVTDERAVAEYTHKDDPAALKMTVGVLGSFELGSAGGCNAAFDILREGTVADVDFPRSYSSGALASPYQACKALVAECLSHPGDTGRLPAHYDAFAILLPDRKP